MKLDKPGPLRQVLATDPAWWVLKQMNTELSQSQCMMYDGGFIFLPKTHKEQSTFLWEVEN